jgi:hypothetical protein
MKVRRNKWGDRMCPVNPKVQAAYCTHRGETGHEGCGISRLCNLKNLCKRANVPFTNCDQAWGALLKLGHKKLLKLEKNGIPDCSFSEDKVGVDNLSQDQLVRALLSELKDGVGPLPINWYPSKQDQADRRERSTHAKVFFNPVDFILNRNGVWLTYSEQLEELVKRDRSSRRLTAVA